jgi:type IV pilus assembly protein PilB
MALFQKTKDSNDAAPLARPQPVEAIPGEAAEECMKVGQFLVESKQLTPEQLAAALGSANGDLLGFADAALKFNVGRVEVADAIARVTQVPLIDSKAIELPDNAKDFLDEKIVRAHCVIAIAEEGGTLVVIAADPTVARKRAVEAAAGRPVRWTISDPTTIRTFIDRTYRADDEIGRLVQSFEVGDDQNKAAALAAEISLDDQAPVIQLVSRIMSQAMRDRASDIHIEPLDEKLRVRFRIDGHLVEAFVLPLSVHSPLTSRLKIMGGMNIVEKRKPQDGQFSTTADGKNIDVRIGIVATVFGEKVVMRILDKSRSSIGLDRLGFPRETYLNYKKLIHMPYGMVICAGPTGAGKTTTLYASLLELNDDGTNVTTVEDPVEYVYPGINQIQTNEQAGLTFATGLKAILRQDPDVILVGEIRDADTARIAVQSALTGHFVLSSLHGNDSVAALHRFLDMGIEAFLIASAVVGVIGQRLLRRICDSCKEPYTPGADELAAFRQHSGGSDKSQFFHGAGCNFCSGTGYRDRIGVYELLRITPELRRLIVGWATTEELRRLAVAQGMRTMLREGMQLVENDVTTSAEVVKTLYAN